VNDHYSDDRTEDFFLHSDRVRIICQNNSRLYEVTLRVITCRIIREVADDHISCPTNASYENLPSRILGFLDVTYDFVICRTASAGISISILVRSRMHRQGTHITGPIKLLKSEGGPTVIFAASDRSVCLNPDDQSEEETYSLDNAEHFCPVHTHHQSARNSTNDMRTLILKAAPNGLQRCISHIC
jgi:hypothetical protein